MRKYILTICETIIRAAFLAGLVASAFIWKENPAQAFAVIFLGAIAFACYLKLDRVETSLSEEKRYNDVWRRDRIAFFGTIFIILFAVGVVLAVILGLRVAVDNPDKVRSKQTSEVVGSMETVRAATTQSSESVVDAIRRLEERLGASMEKVAFNTAVLAKANEDVKALEKSISGLRGDVASLKEAVSGLDQTVRFLEKINRKVLKQKTEK
ncbi:MAG: hypothetical protein E3J72_12510 [Planctomycetota bacterium]|nr:MAG: hypothetical protein E3J72_12510 [Planctomycetota bacterium]